MTSEMIERVAKAMADKAGLIWNVLPDKHDIACGHGMPEGCKDYWFVMARAAIEALTTDDLLKELDRRLGSEPGQKP